MLHVIVGLGATGLSVARYLSEQGVPIMMMDTRENPPQLDEARHRFPDMPLILGHLDEAVLARAHTIVVSPGLSMKTPAIAKQIAKGTEVIGDIELFARQVKAPVIAITGTNAKSTVTTLVGLMAGACGHQVQVGGNLGTPILDLYTAHPEADLFVLELSSFQLETTDSLRPAVATILNITPDHMDRYDTLADYQRAKQRVYQHCEVAVSFADDPLTEPLVPVQKKRYFRTGEPAHNEFGLRIKDGVRYLAKGETLLMSVDELPVLGAHYYTNACAALAIGDSKGFSMASMLRVLRDFKGLPHRCQFVRELKGVTWYNDSKGTNVGATEAAISGLGSAIKGKLVLIAGGQGKHADFAPLAPFVQQYCRHVVLIGQDAQVIANAIQSVVDISFAASLAEAVQQAANQAKPQDSVLLSPACASLDMFRNYEHRGDRFVALVMELGE